MDKLSLYSFLGYLMPGFILVKLVEYGFVLAGKNMLPNITSEVDKNLILFALAIISGIFIHMLSELYLSKRKWYANYFYKHPATIVDNNDNLKKLIPFLSEEFSKISGIDYGKIGIYPKNLFDFAYYYLEVNDKIDATKSFQGFYYFFRNLLIVSFIGILEFIALLLIMFFWEGKYELLDILYPLIICITLLIIAIPCTIFMRKKNGYESIMELLC